MNIIYLLTNSSKTEGKRFYIGAKAECRIETIKEIPTIIDIKTEKPYLGSATDFCMKQDIIKGNTFSASVLKIVNKKEDLLKEENNQILLFNAVENPEYYNHSYATIGGFSYDHNAIINYFGETRKFYNASKSSIGKKNKTAKKFGFKNLGFFSLWIYNEKIHTKHFTKIAEKLGCERHIPARFVESYNLPKCVLETLVIKEDLKFEIRENYLKGASIHKLSEIFKLEIPTICIYLDSFNTRDEKSYLAAARKNLTEEELKIKITKIVLSGKSVKQAAKELGINQFTANRYFLNCIRERLKSNDL